MEIDFETYTLAEQVRKQAALVICNETQVVQPNENNINNALDVIKLCSVVIRIAKVSLRNQYYIPDNEESQ